VERDQKLNLLLSRADDVRRLALDELDAVARRTSTWGSAGHRSARDKVEREYDDQALRFQKLGDAALDSEFARSQAPAAGA
jgi:hypothetical protein